MGRSACDILHKDSIKKLKDQYEEEVKIKVYNCEVEHKERVLQAEKVIRDLTEQLDEVKLNYVGMSKLKDENQEKVTEMSDKLQSLSQELENKNKQILTASSGDKKIE